MSAMANATPPHSFAVNNFKFEIPHENFVLGYFDLSPEHIATNISYTRRSRKCSH